MERRLSAAMEYVLAMLLTVGLVLGVGALWEPVRVSGGSMRPALLQGDLVLVRRGMRPRAGSIVLVRASGHRAVLHRVVAINVVDGAVTTRGDANEVNDRERAESDQIAGVVTRVVPLGVLLERWRGSE